MTTRDRSAPAPTRAQAARPSATRPQAARPSGTASLIALQRSVGNASTLALLRRTSEVTLQAPITLTIPGVVEHTDVSSWHIHSGSHQPVTEVEITRPTDSDSPRLAKAMMEGSPDVTATLLVRKLTPLGWIVDMTVTFDDCMVEAYETDGKFDSVWLRFTAMQVER